MTDQTLILENIGIACEMLTSLCVLTILIYIQT